MELRSKGPTGIVVTPVRAHPHPSSRDGRRCQGELDPNDEIVVHCKSGARSAKAADFLRSVGFKRVLNLKGGILDWVDKVDPSQPKY
jgi:adenylyltransferase/sulfurtransferase